MKTRRLSAILLWAALLLIAACDMPVLAENDLSSSNTGGLGTWNLSLRLALNMFAAQANTPDTPISTHVERLTNSHDSFFATGSTVAEAISQRGTFGQFLNEFLLTLTDGQAAVSNEVFQRLGMKPDDCEQLLQEIIYEMLGGTSEPGIWDGYLPSAGNALVELAGTIPINSSTEVIGSHIQSVAQAYQNVSYRLMADKEIVTYTPDGSLNIIDVSGFEEFVSSHDIAKASQLKKMLQDYLTLLQKDGSIQMPDQLSQFVIRDDDAYWDYLELSWVQMCLDHGAEAIAAAYQSSLGSYYYHLLESGAVTVGEDGKTIIVNDPHRYHRFGQAQLRLSIAERLNLHPDPSEMLSSMSLLIELGAIGDEYKAEKESLRSMTNQYAANKPVLDILSNGVDSDSMLFSACQKVRNELIKSYQGVLFDTATADGLRSILNLIASEGIDSLFDRYGCSAAGQILLGGSLAGKLPYVSRSMQLVCCEKELINLMVLENMIRQALSNAIRDEHPAAYFLSELYYQVRNRGLECCQRYYACYYMSQYMTSEALIKEQELISEQHALYERQLELRKDFVDLINSLILSPLVVNTVNPYDEKELDLHRLELIENAAAYSRLISAGETHAIVKANANTCLLIGKGVGLKEINWENIVKVSAGCGYSVGLKADGTAVVEKDTFSKELIDSDALGQCDLTGWHDLYNVEAGATLTIGIQKDGSVLLAGRLLDPNYDPSVLQGICDAAIGYDHVVGLLPNGRVVATGRNDDGQCEVSEWTNIIAVAAGEKYSVGLRDDGTVVQAGCIYDDPFFAWEKSVSHWRNIIAIAGGYNHVVGLTAHGTAVYSGMVQDGVTPRPASWLDLVAIASGINFTIGVQRDGTLLGSGGPTGFSYYGALEDPYGPYDVNPIDILVHD